jgi:hypothetical protein
MTSNAVIVAVVAALVLQAPAVWAADAREVEELRGEVRQLQAELKTLRMALVEAGDSEQQRSGAVSKALGGAQSSPEPAPASAIANTEAEGAGREPSSPRVSSASTDRPARPSRHRRHKRSSKSRSKAGRVSASDR